MNNGHQSFEILIKGQKQLEDIHYFMEAKQLLDVKTMQGRIIDQKLISEQTIVQKGNNYLPITVNIPETVLTGANYDVDIILEKPLGNAMIAGGLSNITAKQISNKSTPNIKLKPLGGGGLFKSVKAPLNVGIQNWAAILAHPDSLISITKRVSVVSEKSELRP
ncbi:hypothetical protein [Prochlorococcus sp. MIT 1307]|uniref:hypothetical protein n=1 Tax=Prochlorococcus sp. MIT 1307 TaxID=3096219 RepID=UPI002A74E525|nr:hypothetical protein [Prochlorococcus sp. MIT 1307]